jgi:hypothetical protein
LGQISLGHNGKNNGLIINQIAVTVINQQVENPAVTLRGQRYRKAQQEPFQGKRASQVIK